MLTGVRSVAEAKAREIIAASDLPQPQWNQDIYDRFGRWLGRPDAIWPELGVVLEIDSRAWHLSPALWRETQARQRRMSKCGLIVIAVAPTDLLNRRKEILAEIREALENAPARGLPAIVTVG